MKEGEIKVMIRGSVKYQLFQILDDYRVQDEERVVERILAIPEIAIVDRKARLPRCPWYVSKDTGSLYFEARQDISRWLYKGDKRWT